MTSSFIIVNKEDAFTGRQINPLLIFPPESFTPYISRLKFLTRAVISLFPSVKYTLAAFGYQKVDEYVFSSLISAFVMGFIFSVLFYVYASGNVMLEGVTTKSFLIGALVFILFAVLHLIYPSLKAKSYAEEIDRNLLFALKDMLIEIRSGITLYDTLVNVAHSNYGLVSKEISKAVKLANAGMPLTMALEHLARKTQSENLRRILWQLITAVKSGASIEPAIESAIYHVTRQQEEKIRKYVANLNLIVLIYMLAAASLPAMIVPFLMILTCFAAIQVSAALLIKIFAFFLCIQAILIGYVQTSRPINF